MKKTLIASAIVVLLVAGYFMGQVEFSSHKKVLSQSRSTKLFVANEAPSTATPVNGKVAVPSDKGARADAICSSDNNCESPIETSPSCGQTSDCISVPPVTVPVVGNPKGTQIIKTGTVDITIARNSVNKNYDKVVSLIPAGGYVETSSSSKRVSTVTLRIPSVKLDATLVALRKIGTITKESIDSLDRSFDAIDYDARLKIMHERDDVLNAQLKNATTDDTATIQEELFALHTDIETLQGQKDLLDSQVALSTLTVTLTEKGVKAHHAESKSMLSRAWTSAADSLLASLGGILIVLAATLPFLLIGFVVYAGLRPVIRKRRNNRVETNNTLL